MLGFEPSDSRAGTQPAEPRGSSPPDRESRALVSEVPCSEAQTVSRSSLPLLRGKGSRKESRSGQREPPRRVAEEWEGKVKVPCEAGRVWQVLTTPKKRGFPGGSDGQESACNAGGPSSIPRSGRSPGEGNGSPLLYACLEHPTDRGAWWGMLPRAAESDMAEATAHQKREGRTKEENVLNSSVGREFALTLLSLEMTE